MTRLNEFGVGKNVAVPLAAEGAAKYASEQGLVRPNRFDNVLVNIPQARKIAADYEAAPFYDQAAEPHFRAMADETKKQFDYMTRSKREGGLGVDVSVKDTDPYSKAAQMMQDASQGKFSVLSTKQTGGHPYFTDDENDMFRAVHDFFGHAATGRGFDPHGEEAAFRSHYAMFSPKARPAMATETRGQNSTLNYGSKPGKFAPQKIVTLPSAQLITPIGRRAAFAAALSDAKAHHARMLKGFDRSE